ncbi:hypothetical protein ACFYYB_41060 [Streptomyces sp. NPDC002886]|uniref:hypothetical protein n=1 Tax=Streptomyces sp. NPDC002886 TaxID=3364667 RepID=UPI003682F557
MWKLVDELHDIEKQQYELGLRHASVMRALVLASGGVKEAASLLRLDPKTVRARERATDLALILYRGDNTDKVGPDGRVYGELGDENSPAQRDADRMWFIIAQDKRSLLRAMVYVVNGQVRRVRAVLDDAWEENEQGRVAVPIGPPLSAPELIEAFPGLPFTLGDARPMVRGKIREYLALSSGAEVTR